MSKLIFILLFCPGVFGQVTNDMEASFNENDMGYIKYKMSFGAVIRTKDTLIITVGKSRVKWDGKSHTLYIGRKKNKPTLVVGVDGTPLYLYQESNLDSATLKAMNSEGKTIKRRGK